LGELLTCAAELSAEGMNQGTTKATARVGIAPKTTLTAAIAYVWNSLDHWCIVQLQGAAGAPALVLLCEVKLHEVASH
jgi:hypothetical protein